MQLANMSMQNTKQSLLQTVASYPEMVQFDGACSCNANWLEMGLRDGHA